MNAWMGKRSKILWEKDNEITDKCRTFSPWTYPPGHTHYRQVPVICIDRTGTDTVVTSVTAVRAVPISSSTIYNYCIIRKKTSAIVWPLITGLHCTQHHYQSKSICSAPTHTHTMNAGAFYTVNHKKRATLFLIITLAFLSRFLYFSTSGNRKEYSTSKLTKFTTSP